MSGREAFSLHFYLRDSYERFYEVLDPEWWGTS